jgi:hypothetical protein
MATSGAEIFLRNVCYFGDDAPNVSVANLLQRFFQLSGFSPDSNGQIKKTDVRYIMGYLMNDILLRTNIPNFRYPDGYRDLNKWNTIQAAFLRMNFNVHDLIIQQNEMTSLSAVPYTHNHVQSIPVLGANVSITHHSYSAFLMARLGGVSVQLVQLFDRIYGTVTFRPNLPYLIPVNPRIDGDIMIGPNAYRFTSGVPQENQISYNGNLIQFGVAYRVPAQVIIQAASNVSVLCEGLFINPTAVPYESSPALPTSMFAVITRFLINRPFINPLPNAPTEAERLSNDLHLLLRRSRMSDWDAIVAIMIAFEYLDI